jgi:hypothetical protein
MPRRMPVEWHVVVPAKATFVVMPAEAGIQALHGIARLARDLKSYLWVAGPRKSFVRALRARFEKLMAGGSAPAPWVTLSLFAQRKVTKRKRTPWSALASPVPSRLAGLRGYAHGASLRRVRTRGIHAAPLWACASAARGARLDQGGLKTPYLRFTSSKLGARGFPIPVARAEYRRPTGGF